MKVARALAVVSLVLFPLFDAAAADAAAALATLEKARADLAKAVERIQKDPPSTPDLESAHAAVGALKDAIDAGAEHEEKDLDFAKAVLAARKELRTQREYVDQRRANVDIHNQRRTIDQALARLDERAKRLEAKDAAPKDFDDARAAAEALKKPVEEARPLGKKDAKFATYLTEVDATLARQTKAIDDRWVLQSADKQKALLEESRAALTAAMAPLAKTATDAEFEAADKAMAAVTRRLDDGKGLEPKSAPYRADAERARKELTAAKKRMDDLWSETGLARLKAEIEPAHKDLLAAAKGVRAKKPSSEQLAEAKTASIVVRKLLEKFQAEAGRSKALGQYVAEVNRALVDLEVELQRRSLDVARADLTQALRPIGGKAPTAEQFDEATTAVGILEKTIATVNAKEPAMKQPVAEAQAILRDSKATLAARRLELDVVAQSRSLAEARAEVTKALKPIGGKAPTDEQFAEANTALGILEKTIASVNAKEPAMKQPVVEAQAILRDSKATLAARRLELDVQAQTRSLAEARAEVTKSLKPIGTKAPTDENFAEADTALGILEKTIASVNAKEPAMKQPLAEAQAIARDTKATLAARRLELDVAAQLRSLNAARAELTKTLRPIGGKAPSDDHFAEANTAVGILEKTIATVNAKEPSLVQPVAEAKALVRDSKATLNARRIELDVGEQRTRVEDARKLAGDLLKEISTLPIAKDRLEATDAAIKQIKAALDEGAELTGKDKAYAAYDREVKTRATELEGKLAARRVAQAAFDGKAQLTETHAAAKAKVDAARLPEASDADLAAASKSVELVGKTIEAQAGLEKQDKGYADRAAKARADLQRLNESLDFGKQARELRRQTVEALAAGAAGADGAPGKPLRGQKDQYEKAIAQFRSCVGTGGSMLAENRALEGVALFVDGKKTPAKDVIALCTTRLENTEKLLVLVKPLIAFDEGLKQNYEKGKALLAQSKPADALKHFNECISSGGILQNRSPELKERKFEVAGAEMTLPEVIQQCIANRKALMAKK